MKTLLKIIVFSTYATGSFYTAVFHYTNMNTVRFSAVFGIGISLISAVAFIIAAIIELFEWRKHSEATFLHLSNTVWEHVMIVGYGALAFMAINMAMFHFINMDNIRSICFGVISYFIAGILGLIIMVMELEERERKKEENRG